MSDRAQSIILPGTLACLEREDFADEVMLLRYRFHLAKSQQVIVMFNTHEACRVWVDGVYRFGRAGGVMAPSFHRVPKDQSVDLALEKGWHELLAVVARPRADHPAAQWVAGVGDRQTRQWLVHASDRPDQT